MSAFLDVESITEMVTAGAGAGSAATDDPSESQDRTVAGPPSAPLDARTRAARLRLYEHYADGPTCLPGESEPPPDPPPAPVPCDPDGDASVCPSPPIPEEDPGTADELFEHLLHLGHGLLEGGHTLWEAIGHGIWGPLPPIFPKEMPSLFPDGEKPEDA